MDWHEGVDTLYMEGQPIVLPPIFKGPTAIGDLYDCHNSTSLGLNLFGRNLNSDQLQANVMNGRHFSLTRIRSTKDRQKAWRVSGHVALELIGELMKVGDNVDDEINKETDHTDELLLCHYQLETFSVRALPSSREVMDTLVVERMLKGDVKPTHIVVGYSLGAEVLALIQIVASNPSNEGDVKGHFFRKLALGPLVGSAKVALEALDISKEFATTIKFHSKPRLKRPSTVKDIFSAIASIASVVETEKHPAFTQPQSNGSRMNIIGIPLRYHLVPISHFFDIPHENLYLQLKVSVLENVIGLLVTLKDYQQNGSYKTIILEKEPRLRQIILDNKTSFIKTITAREQEIQKLCKSHFSTVMEAFKKYKFGLVDQQQLLDLMHKAAVAVNITSILQEVAEFIAQGLQATGLEHMNMVKTGNLKIITETKDLLNWYQIPNSIKILLRTGGHRDITAGRVAALHNICSPLNQSGVDIAVAVPACSENRTDISIQIKDSEVTYGEDDLDFVILILHLVVDEVSFPSVRLFTIYASLNGIKLPLINQLGDLHNIIKVFKDLKSVKIADSYLTVRNYALDKDNRWKFVVDLDALDSATLAINKFRFLNTQLYDLPIDWIVGKFGFETSWKNTNSPLLFVFKNECLEAICYDNIDILLLTRLLKVTASDALNEEKEKIFQILKPQTEPFASNQSCIHKERADFGLKVIQLFGNCKPLEEDCPGGPSLVINGEVEEFQNLLRCFLNQDWNGTLTTSATILCRQFQEIKDIFQSNNCNPTLAAAFPEEKSVDTKQLAEHLKDFLYKADPLAAKMETLLTTLKQSYFHDSDGNVPAMVENVVIDKNCPKELSQLLQSCQENNNTFEKNKKMEEALEGHMQSMKRNKYSNLVLFIRFLESSTSPFVFQEECIFSKQLLPNLMSDCLHIDGSKYPGVEARLESLIKNQEYYAVSHLLSQVKYFDNELYLVGYHLEGMTSLTDSKGLCQLLQMLAPLKLSQQYYEVLFSNPKFAYLLDNNSDSSELLRTLKDHHCFKSNIGAYIPSPFLAPLEKMLAEDFDDMPSSPEILKTVEELTKYCQRIASRDIVPDNFMKLLRDSVTTFPELKAVLQNAEALKYWSEKHEIFLENWDVETIRQACNKLAHQKSSSKESSSDGGQKRDDAVSLFNIQMPNKNSSENPLQNGIQGQIPDSEQGHKLIRLESTATEDLPKWWTQLLGSGTLPKSVDNDSFLELKQIIPEPELRSEEEGYLAGLLPYFIQRLKMWGVFVIEPDHLEKLHRISPSLPEQHVQELEVSGEKTKLVFNIVPNPTDDFNISAEPTEAANCPLSRIDILSCLNGLCNRLVFQDLLRIISQFPASLPLLLQDIPPANFHDDSESPKLSSICLLPLLKSFKVKWERQPGVVIHNQLFVHPFRLITAIRAGEIKAGDSGKSTILNQVLSSPNIFSSFANPGSQNGIPMTLNGAVELIPLLPETCSSPLWEEVVKVHYTSPASTNQVLLLANVHGDALELPAALELLLELSSVFVVFFTPCSVNALQEKCLKIDEMLGHKDEIIHVLVDPTPECLNIGISSINTNQLTNGVTLKKVRSLLAKGIRMGVAKQDFEFTSTLPKEITVSPNIVTRESAELMGLVAQLGCGEVKSTLKLQKLNPKYDPDFLPKAQRIWQRDLNLQKLISNFVAVLHLPIKSRMVAFAHLDSALSTLSNTESTLVRGKLTKLQEQKRRALSLDKDPDSCREQKRLTEQIRATLDELNEMSFGMEHLYRELGRLYQAAQGISSEVKSNPTILSLPNAYAQLLIKGQAIEILDGDIGDMCGPWLDSICHAVCQVYPTLRIFTLSIIGLQSSGKSTLLNALFACKFAVSVGRCTRGLFMRLIFLDKTVVQDLNVDAILLIDTEGLGAPEKLNDPDAEHKDRLLATFAISVSNLTLINVLGESLRDLTDILQIVIVTMARLEKADICPDILMVQHLTERDNSKTARGIDEFCQALEQAVAITDTNDTTIGVKSSKSLKKLEYRVRNGEFLQSFSPFKDGASANAPPSAEYHKDVLDLYKIILESCRQLKHPQNFHKWHSLIQEYWAAVSIQDFSLRFKNIQEVQEFIERGSAIAKVKEAVDGAFRVHREASEVKLRQTVNQLFSRADGFQNWEKKKELELGIIREGLKWIPNNCDPQLFGIDGHASPGGSPCGRCSDAVSRKAALFREVEGKNCQLKTEATINLYIQKMRDYSMKHLIQMIEAARAKHGWSCEFDARIGSILQQKLQQDPKMSEDKINKQIIVNEVWSWLQKEVSTGVQLVPAARRICEEVRKEYEHATAFWMRFHGKVDFSKTPDLRTFKAIDLNDWDRLTSKVKVFVGYEKQKSTLNINQVTSLEAALDSIPALMLKNYETDHYEDGMMKLVRARVEEVLYNFMAAQEIKLFPEFKWEVHAYAIIKFIRAMNTAEKEWNKNNNPYYILCQNEESYKKKIEIRLEHGFGFDAEARIIGEELLKAIRKRGQKQGDRSYIDLIRTTSWLSCSESVRLRFFSELAQEVQDGSSGGRARKYFANPKLGMQTWFEAQVNAVPDRVGIKSFIDTVDSEFERIKQEIRNQTSTQGIKNFIEDYFSKVEGDISYIPGVDLAIGSTAELQLLQTGIQNKMDEGKNSLKKNIYLTTPYTQEEIRALMGCTEHCFWCGSLCWGQAGHEENMDSTKKHHASHQPRGLIGINAMEQKYLISGTCENVDEDCKIFWAGCKEGMSWGLTKVHPDFENWTFNAHNKTEFNDLMKWFFVKLHKEIATSYELLPARDSDLADLGYNNLLSLNHILTTIKSNF